MEKYWLILDQCRLVAYRYWTSFFVITGTDIHVPTELGLTIAIAIAAAAEIVALAGPIEKSDVDRHWSAENLGLASVCHSPGQALQIATCDLSFERHSTSTAIAAMELSVLVELANGSCFAMALGLQRSNHDVYYLLFVVSNLIYDVDLFGLQKDLASYLHSLPIAWTVNSSEESDAKQAIAAATCSTRAS